MLALAAQSRRRGVGSLGQRDGAAVATTVVGPQFRQAIRAQWKRAIAAQTTQDAVIRE